MKQILIFCILISLMQSQSIYTHDHESKKASLEIIAALSDDIAELVINARHTKDPHIAKTACKNIIVRMTDLIATIIEKIQARKKLRGLELYSDQEYQQDLELIITEI